MDHKEVSSIGIFSPVVEGKGFGCGPFIINYSGKGKSWETVIFAFYRCKSSEARCCEIEFRFVGQLVTLRGTGEIIPFGLWNQGSVTVL